ncbi:putative late blight resistance protein homolog R1A-10 [Ipomoea triloba]|uniref:putative late blight resistance protein homolog R1A-10 n=1 Tax=Ipomoea triloba TaxID=35885 RepID=UPI00125D2E08|nr:putative late blight resistance protein homolog R1A-10 [Ipomoea triloba]XP_031107281.1 putative late blight resistance protein homolog R1A-10 [Ipomoea triloba]
MAISLVNLLNTIHFHFLQPLPCLSVDDTERIMIESLCKKLRFLQAFVEDSQKNNINCPAWRDLETEIRDVAAEAETKIDNINYPSGLLSHSERYLQFSERISHCVGLWKSWLHPKKELINCRAGRSLETEIRDVAAGAESKIELELYKLYSEEEAPVEPCESLHQTLQQVTGDIESLERRILQIESNDSVEPPRTNAAIQNIKADSSSKRSTEPENEMVGCDDEFETIKNKLISDSNNLEVISITGMGGIGKTTLAQRVYNGEAAMAHFDIRTWTTVSQEHNLGEMLCRLLGNNDTNPDVSNLASQLRQKLLGHRYLIVIDDIWSTQAWDDIHRCFPEDFNGSRILLTTRLKQVADYVSSGNNLYSMRFLNLNESWDLFYKKVFVEKKFPLEFEKVGRRIVEKCQGLPLTIIVVGGLLSSSSNKPSLNQWENVVANLDPLLNIDPEMKCSKILSLSYNHLPPHLKACFLYFGIFSEDRVIKVKELIRLWIAEGFLKLELNKTMEEVAYDYLQDLVDRCLVQIDKWSVTGNKIKYCKLHDVLHSFSLREARREKLLCVINEKNNVGLATSSLDRKACRWVVSDHLNHIYDEPISQSRNMTHTSHELRSFIYLPHSIIFERFNSRILPYSKLLRVLNMSQSDLIHVPKEIVDLVHLRYLALRIQSITSIDYYPWFKLRCLQSLIISQHLAYFLPNYILGMPQIRHVHFFHGSLNYLHLPKLVQRNLQTLYWLSLPHRLHTEPDFKGIPNVKELGIYLMGYKYSYFKMSYLSKETWDLLPPISLEGLLNLHQLENLKFERNQSSPKCDSKLLKAFPPNLKKLTLTRTNFSWEDMVIINTLPNLEVLKLRKDAFCGPEWKATGNGFCKLKYLEVTKHSTLKHWSVDADHFPILECISLNSCHLLVEFPTGFGDINTLQLIDLKHCPSSLVTSAKNIQEERRDFGDDKLVLRELYTFPEPEVEIER